MKVKKWINILKPDLTLENQAWNKGWKYIVRSFCVNANTPEEGLSHARSGESFVVSYVQCWHYLYHHCNENHPCNDSIINDIIHESANCKADDPTHFPAGLGYLHVFEGGKGCLTGGTSICVSTSVLFTTVLTERANWLMADGQIKVSHYQPCLGLLGLANSKIPSLLSS